MAVEFREDEDRDEQQPMMGAGPVSPGAAPAAAPARRQLGTGQAANIRQYIQANLPFRAQAGGLAGAISERAEQRAGEVGRGVERGRQAFEAAARPIEEQVGERGRELIQTAFKDPQQLLQQQQQLQQFQQLRQQQLQPQIQQLAPGLQQAQQQAQMLQQQAQQAGGEAGRFQLLREQFGTPTYTTGQQRLDQLLLQAAPGQARQLQTRLGQLAGQAGQQIAGLQSEAAARRAALGQLAGQRAEEIQTLFERGAEAEGLETELGQRGYRDIQEDIQARLAAAQAGAPAELEQFRQRLATRELTPEDIQQLGLTAGQAIYDVDLAEFISPATAQATVSGIMSPEEFARYSALQELTGATPFAAIEEAQLGTYRPYEVAGVGALGEAIQRRGAQAESALGTLREAAGLPGLSADPEVARQELSELTGQQAATTAQQIGGELKLRTPPADIQELAGARGIEDLQELYTRLSQDPQRARSPFTGIVGGLLNQATQRQQLLEQYAGFSPTATLIPTGAAREKFERLQPPAPGIGEPKYPVFE